MDHQLEVDSLFRYIGWGRFVSSGEVVSTRTVVVPLLEREFSLALLSAWLCEPGNWILVPVVLLLESFAPRCLAALFSSVDTT